MRRTGLALALSTLLGSAALGDDPPPGGRLFSAAEIQALARGVPLPRPGEYQVWVWSPAGAWTLSANAAAIYLAPHDDWTDPAPGWRWHGTIRHDPAAPLKALIGPRPDQESPPPKVPAFLYFATGAKVEPGRLLDIVRGDVKSTAPVVDPRRTTSRTLDEGINFRPPTTGQAWLDRSDRLRSQLLVSLGLRPIFPKTDLRPRMTGKVARDGYTIEKVALETLPGFTLGGNLYRPTGLPGRLPLVLSPHGHYPEGRLHPDVQARAAWWAKRYGCVVFSYDMVGYNDTSFGPQSGPPAGKPPGHTFASDRLRRSGLSLATLQTWNSIRALDWASSLPDVDPSRVGCTGESGGGTQTFLLAAIDPRVKVVAPVVMVSHKMQGGCECENAPGLRIGTDNVEIAALAAPRPMKLVGADDWTDETLTVEYPTLLKIYGLIGSADRLSASKFNFPHNYNRTSREAVYAFMGKWLAGIDDPAAAIEGDLAVEPPKVLRCFGEGDSPPADARTAAQVESDLVAVVARSVDRLGPTTVAAPWEAARAHLRETLRVRVGLVEPAPVDLTTVEVRRLVRDGLAIGHSTVTRREGDRVPVVRLSPREVSGRVTIVSTPRGKAGLAAPDGSPSPLVRALLDRGQSVIGYDPIFVGESLDPEKPAPSRPAVAMFSTYNPTLPADRMQDLATVVAWAKSRPDVREVNLVAIGEAGTLALLARPLLSGLGRTAIDLDGFSYGDGSGTVPPGLDLPGVLQFGGPAVAAALTSPAPLRLAGVPGGFARAWPTRSYALDDATGLLAIDAATLDPATLATWIDRGE